MARLGFVELIYKEQIKLLDRKLRKIGDRKIIGKYARRAAAASAKVIQAEALKRAPVKSGLLEDTIKVRAYKGKDKRKWFGRSVTAGNRQSYYGASLEQGTIERYTSLNQYRGRIDKNKEATGGKFMYRSFRAKRRLALRQYRDTLKTNLMNFKRK
jgi:hypothetical protein